MKTQADLIGELKRLGYLKSPRLEAALKKVDRRDFMPEDLKDLAYVDEALPIGSGQTTSQPLTIVFMLELAELREGEKVLEVGTGSGWQTALLAEIVEPKGKVVSVERIGKIQEFAKTNLSRYDYRNIELVIGDGSRGYKPGAPYDVIIAGAEAEKVPRDWKDQLKPGGRTVFPMGGSVYRLLKRKDGSFSEEHRYGFTFVPLIEEE